MSKQMENTKKPYSTAMSPNRIDEGMCKAEKGVNITISSQPNMGADDLKNWSMSEETTFETASEFRGLDRLHEHTIASLAMQRSRIPPAPGTYDVVLTGKSHFAVNDRKEIRYDPIHHLDYNCIFRANLVKEFGDQIFVDDKNVRKHKVNQ
ncbi:unnamed protein product [Orchesella dallaii]|uniref:Uncharacterized protein n=1 Tax=Orchesella dallaii TaxID=48710 RepID=A0ABP1QJ71_9HEXA